MNQKTKRKRDIYMMTILVVVFVALFLIFKLVIYTGQSTYAYIYYGTGEPIVTVDFSQDTVVINYEQSVDESYMNAYPSINLNGEDGYTEITLLGDYTVSGIRQEVIIAVDFSQDRIRVKDEKSPLHVCSKQGWSTAAPLICLPNQIRVEFDATSSTIDFIQ